MGSQSPSASTRTSGSQFSTDGRYQLRSPSSFMLAGTRTNRTIAGELELGGQRILQPCPAERQRRCDYDNPRPAAAGSGEGFGRQVHNRYSCFRLQMRTSG